MLSSLFKKFWENAESQVGNHRENCILLCQKHLNIQTTMNKIHFKCFFKKSFWENVESQVVNQRENSVS